MPTGQDSHDLAMFGPYPLCLVLVRLQEFQALLVYFKLRSPLLSQELDIVQSFRIPRSCRQTPLIRKSLFPGLSPESPSSRIGEITHLVASKISSNFFLRAAGSERGQFDSS